jgi:hypothetical protein
MAPYHSASASPVSADDQLASLPPELEPELNRLCDAVARGLAGMYRRRQATPVPLRSAERPDLPRAA